MKDLKHKVAVVTGAGSGIGRALAIALAAEGCHLAISDIKEDRLKETEELIGSKDIKVHSFVLDAGNREGIHEYAEQVANHFGRVDIVVNNAGVALGKVTGEDLTYEDFDWIMNINFWGMVAGSKAFLPHLKKQKEGVIVNISSLFGLIGVPYQTAYCATKFAIRGFTEALRAELQVEDPHIHAFAVHPGGIKTNIANDSKRMPGADPKVEAKELEQFNKLLKKSPADAAQSIIKAIRKKKKRLVIGSDAWSLDWIVRRLPGFYTTLIANRVKRELK